MLTATSTPPAPLAAGEQGAQLHCDRVRNLKVLSKQNVLRQVLKQFFLCLLVVFGVPVNFNNFRHCSVTPPVAPEEARTSSA